ncbi:hypothetical protein JAO29_14745 [Edaphobacter sp. HDX4]|uniref:hypothetical protein n=1 Tax=Edaphobacter sp. HDX4 TaxID=2794064 RepID=UPI002FE57CC3
MDKGKKRNYIPDQSLPGSQERPRNELPTLGVNFTEAVGKIIAFVNVVNDPPNWQALEIRFTDGTLLHFEFLTTETRIKPRYMEARHGDLELIRSYGTLLTDDERTARQRATEGDDDGPYCV